MSEGLFYNSIKRGAELIVVITPDPIGYYDGAISHNVMGITEETILKQVNTVRIVL